MKCPDCKSKKITYAGFEPEFGDMSQCESCGVVYPSDEFIAEEQKDDKN
ncbi:hypothetical protein Elgi_37460 [Paenibacillus elgii]|nr:hypothetical protein Elgi_37460 [Paenibacillus elgii]